MLSSDESDFINDESYYFGSDSGYFDTYSFVLIICVLTSSLVVLVVCGMDFLHQQE